MFGFAVDVLWIARYDYKRNSRLIRHEHDYFQMIYFLSGSGRLLLDNREYSTLQGNLFLIKPHCVHDLLPASPVKTLDVKFRVTGDDLYMQLLSCADMVSGPVANAAALLEQIRTEGERKGYLYRESCSLFLMQILIQYLRQDQCQAPAEIVPGPELEVPDDHTVQRALDFIHQHYAEDIDLPQIAATVQRSDRYVRQHFESCLGVSPMRYVLQYRLGKAKELIRYSDCGLKDIAEAVEFKTIHHFNASFTRTSARVQALGGGNIRWAFARTFASSLSL
jgi:AraC-like DNA-binding protein